jgi:hypothetical protein
MRVLKLPARARRGCGFSYRIFFFGGDGGNENGEDNKWGNGEEKEETAIKEKRKVKY